MALTFVRALTLAVAPEKAREMENRASVLQEFARFCLPRRLLPFSLRRQRRTMAAGLGRCSSTAALSHCMEGALRRPPGPPAGEPVRVGGASTGTDS